MVLFNYSTKELTAKIVYYGPGLCGKTTNLQYIHQNLPQTVKGKMLSLATKTDRTLFFDFLPIDLGEIRGMQTRVQLYTVPGQVFYNETRKLVLKGADGIVFVADSQKQMVKANIESFKNLEDNLRAHGLNLAEMPHVIQFNKRDLPKLATIDEMNKAINHFNAPFYESVATTGIGVQDSLKAITKLVLLHLTKKYDPKAGGAQAAKPKAAPASPTPMVQVPTAPVTSIPMAAAPAAVATAKVSAPAPISIAAAMPVDHAAEDMEEASEVYFGDPELDTMVDEVSSPPAPSVAAQPMPSAPAPAARAAAPALEVDRRTDSDWNPTATIQAGSMPNPPQAAQPQTVTLTQAVGDRALFEDPSMQIAKLASGAGKTIVVPVELGNASTGTQRFKLSIRLCLDPVDD